MDSEERDRKLERDRMLREAKLDSWLDNALAGYSAAEPRPGLEQRINVTFRAEDRVPSSPRRWWIFLTPAATVLAVLFVFVSVSHRNSERAVTRSENAVAKSTEAGEQKDKIEAREGKTEQTQAQTYLTANKTKAAEPRTTTPKSAQPKQAKEVATMHKQGKEQGVETGVVAQASRVDAENETTTAMDKVSGGILPRNEASATYDLRSAAPVESKAAAAAKVASAPQVATSPRVTPANETSESVEVSAAAPMVEARERQNVVPVPPPMARAAMLMRAAPQVGGRTQFPLSTPVTYEERLMMEAAARGALRPSVQTLPPKDELLPTIQIHEITIEPLKNPEK